MLTHYVNIAYLPRHMLTYNVNMLDLLRHTFNIIFTDWIDVLLLW
jgi:hypothetical protein